MSEPTHSPAGSGIGPDATIETSSDVIAQRLGDETILVHLDTNLMFDLNRTASRLWELAQGSLTRRQIEETLLREFAVDACELSREVDQLLLALHDRKLIKIIHDGAG